jgi:hypothetical protein
MMVTGAAEKVTSIVCGAETEVNVYVLFTGTEIPSTVSVLIT